MQCDSLWIVTIHLCGCAHGSVALTGWARRLVPGLGSPVQSQAGSLQYNGAPAEVRIWIG